LSTILDALRKAQDETAKGTREVPIDQMPSPEAAVAPRTARPRRALTWLAGIAAVLGLAFVGGLALGNRVSDLLVGERAPTATTTGADAPQERAVAAAPVAAAHAERPSAAEEDSAPVEAAPERVAAVPVQRAPAERRAPREPVTAPAVAQPAADGEPVPTPYGRLHVFGAAEAPGAGASAAGEERAARLRQLREKMLRARLESAERTGGRAPEEAIAIAVPPPGGADDGAVVAAVPADPAAGGVAPAAPSEAPGQVAAVADARPPTAPRPAPIGVSVASGAAATDGEIHDPDIAAPGEHEEVVAAPEPEPATEAVPEPVAEVEEPPAVVASVPPAPAAQPAPQVLRRAPGGAPQVSINILQWSAEPGRRFAFVSVDGGGMTQVREGDRIGGLTIKHIHQQMIEFGFNDSTFLLRAN